MKCNACENAEAVLTVPMVISWLNGQAIKSPEKLRLCRKCFLKWVTKYFKKPMDQTINEVVIMPQI